MLHNVALVQHVGNMLQGIEHCSISHNMLQGTSKDLYGSITDTLASTLSKFIVSDY